MTKLLKNFQSEEGSSRLLFSHSMLKWISKNAENKGVINKEQRSNWLEDLQNRGQSDSFFFCVNRFLFTAYIDKK